MSTAINEDVAVGDGVQQTAAIMKDNLLERLNKRNKERQNYLDVKLEQRNKENLKLEGADYFAATFTERAKEIEAHIQKISESTTVKAGAELARVFSDITLQIQELQRYLTNSTMFLTDYKIKACQSVLSDLTSRSEGTRIKLMPKKKFGFSAKKMAPPTALNPKVYATDKLDAPEKHANTLATKSSSFEWTLSNRSGEYILLNGDEVNGKDITISNLKNCFVELQGHAGSVQISNADSCTLLCGPIARSLFAENCRDCTLALACQQLRLHSSSACLIYLHVTCRAIIEDCKDIQVADYNYEYSTLAEDFQQASLDRQQNNYVDVADFNWLSPDVPSPNWSLLKDSIKAPNWHELRESFKKGDNNSISALS